MENTENAGGTRFSAGKVVQVWAPWRGLDLVLEIARDWENLGYEEDGSPNEELLGSAHMYLADVMSDPMSLDEGHLKAAHAQYLILQILHNLAGGDSDDPLPLLGLDFMCRVSVMGAAKYAPFDYRNGQSFSSLLSCANRHTLKAMAKGVDAADDESGLLHLGHTTWNLLCLLEFIDDGRFDLDDVSPWIGITAAQKVEAERVAKLCGCSVLAVLRDYRSDPTLWRSLREAGK